MGFQSTKRRKLCGNQYTKGEATVGNGMQSNVNNCYSMDLSITVQKVIVSRWTRPLDHNRNYKTCTICCVTSTEESTSENETSKSEEDCTAQEVDVEDPEGNRKIDVAVLNEIISSHLVCRHCRHTFGLFEIERKVAGFLLLCTLAFVSPALTFAMRDKELHIYENITTGPSGVMCTKFQRRCIDIARCVNQRCECPATAPKGEGEIECVKDDEKLCYISSDPHVHAFGDGRVDVNLPCRYRAARFVTGFVRNNAHVPFGTCGVEVYVINEELRGRYVVSSVHISVGVTDVINHAHASFEVNKTSHYEVNSTDIYNYQIHIIKRDSIWGSSNGNVPYIDVHGEFDDINNFAVLNVPHCDTRIKFRAYHPTQKHQTQLPGVTIQAPLHANFIQNHGSYPESMCGTPDDSTSLYKDRAEALGLVNAATAAIYDILKQRPAQTENPLADKCMAAMDLFKSSTHKRDDLNACSFSLVTPDAGRCLTGRATYLPIDVFNACLQVRKDRSDPNACRVITQAYNDCNIHWKAGAPTGC